MTSPPRLSAWLLELALAPSDRDAVAGDLWEEFHAHIVPCRGAAAARWWYRLQVVRSLAPLFVRSWERASLARASAAVVSAAVALTVPVSLLLTLRTFVLQQVPLKTTAEVSLSFAVVLVLLVAVSGACGFVAAVRLLHTESRDR